MFRGSSWIVVLETEKRRSTNHHETGQRAPRDAAYAEEAQRLINQPMPRRSPDSNASPSGRTPKLPFNLLAKHNRGLLLDLVIFVANLFLLRLLSSYVLELFARADRNDDEAKFLLLVACIAMWVLPAAGAVLKRWRFHQRLRAEHRSSALALRQDRQGSLALARHRRPGLEHVSQIVQA